MHLLTTRNDCFLPLTGASGCQPVRDLIFRILRVHRWIKWWKKSCHTDIFLQSEGEFSHSACTLCIYLGLQKIINGDNMTCWHLRVKMGMVWKDDGKENDLPIGGHLWGGKLAGIWQEELDINTHSHTHRHSQSRNDCHKVLVCVSWSNQCYPTILNHAWRIWVCLGHWFFQ